MTTLPAAAVNRLADILATHWRVNPPGGRCSCGHEVPLGERFTAHQVRALLADPGPLLEALAPHVAVREAQAAAKALREAAGEILSAVGPVVPHEGGSAGVYTNAPNGDSMALWSYSNAVAYTGATIEIVGLIDRRADRVERGES